MNSSTFTILLILLFVKPPSTQTILHISHSYFWDFKNMTISINGTLSINLNQSGEDQDEGGEDFRRNKYDKIYSCTMDSGNVTQKRLISGSRAWHFPRQNTSLILEYPSKDIQRSRLFSKNTQPIITSFRVDLYQDTAFSEGYVTSGGVLEDNIALHLMSSGATSLAYDFEVYGLSPGEVTQVMVDSIQCS